MILYLCLFPSIFRLYLHIIDYLLKLPLVWNLQRSRITGLDIFCTPKFISFKFHEAVYEINYTNGCLHDFQAESSNWYGVSLTVDSVILLAENPDRLLGPWDVLGIQVPGLVGQVSLQHHVHVGPVQRPTSLLD